MHNNRTAHALIPRLAISLAISTSLLLAACGSDEISSSALGQTTSSSGSDANEATNLSVAEALMITDDEIHEVEGFVVGDSGRLWLCAALAESFPPQCGGPRLALAGAATAQPETLLPGKLTTSGETQWTEDPVVLSGVVIGEELWVNQ